VIAPAVTDAVAPDEEDLIAAPAARPDAAWAPPVTARTPVVPESRVAPTAQTFVQPTVQAAVGVGRWFQPLPGTPPLAGDGTEGPGARIVAAGGTPVHAVTAATVLAGGSAGAMRLRTGTGVEIGYAGMATESLTVTTGEQVVAGAILGTVAGAAGPGSRGQLVLTAHDPAGTALDTVRLLLGLPDPNELGFAAVGGGLGADPDELDRMLGGV
jgi:murein DD-endopeptidase MepM/ murein hydrolase activator NlpD